MSKPATAILATLLLALAAAPVAAQEVELVNDDFTSGDAAYAQGGFVVGEMGASRFVPDGSGPFTVKKVRFLFGGATTTQTVTIHVYDDTAGTDAPGSELYSGDFEVTGSDSVFYEADLSLDNVQVPGNFRVAIEFQHEGFPAIMRDSGGLDYADRNFIFGIPGGWFQSWLGGVPGDWIIRAVITAAEPTPDAGPTPDAAPGGPDAGPTPDAAPGGPDAGTGQECNVHSECPTGQYCDDQHQCTYDCRIPSDCPEADMECTSLGQCVAAEDGGGGCGCRTGGSTDLGASALLLLFGLLAVGRRRRAR